MIKSTYPNLWLHYKAGIEYGEATRNVSDGNVEFLMPNGNYLNVKSDSKYLEPSEIWIGDIQVF